MKQTARQNRKIVELEFRLAKMEKEKTVRSEISENDVNGKWEVGRDLTLLGDDEEVNDESKIVRAGKVGKDWKNGLETKLGYMKIKTDGRWYE